MESTFGGQGVRPLLGHFRQDDALVQRWTTMFRSEQVVNMQYFLRDFILSGSRTLING